SAPPPLAPFASDLLQRHSAIPAAVKKGTPSPMPKPIPSFVCSVRPSPLSSFAASAAVVVADALLLVEVAFADEEGVAEVLLVGIVLVPIATIWPLLLSICV